MSEDKFSISVSSGEHSAQLVVNCSWLDSPDYLDFRSECYRLLETEQPNLRIDLGKLDSISSMFLGILVETSIRAREGGQQVTVAAGKTIAELLQTFSGDMVEIEESAGD
jgi:anti-anti-sigma regulatory factor